MSVSAGPEPAWIRGFHQVTTRALGPHQTAVVRIGIAGVWLLLLLREWPNRHELYGPDGALEQEQAVRLSDSTGAFSTLLWSDSVIWFELGYGFAALASVALLLGWRTRTASVLFMIGVLSVHNRNPFVADGGDNLTHLLAIYLVATRCGQVWSLDARRERRGGTGWDLNGVALWSALGLALAAASMTGELTAGWALVFWTLWLVHGLWWALRRSAGELRAVCDQVANLVHNGALLVIIAQVCLLYAAAGWYKIQGTRWQDGTAVFYPLQIADFTPWPALSDLLSSHPLLVVVLTYGTVIIQVAFPFTLLNRRAKNVMLVMLIGEHVGIAILLGLPFFSLAIIAADLIFLPTNFLRLVERRVRSLIRRRGKAVAQSRETPETIPAIARG